jgi:hypothetical protein
MRPDGKWGSDHSKHVHDDRERCWDRGLTVAVALSVLKGLK